MLIEEYREQFNRQLGCRAARIDANASQALVNYSWPGNVRELINVMERAVLLCRGSEIGLAGPPPVIAEAAPAAARLFAADRPPFGLDDGWIARPLREVRTAAVETVETAYLAELLTRTKGRIGETA